MAHLHLRKMGGSKDREKVWPGVTPTQICGVLRGWVLKQKSPDVVNLIADLIGKDFKIAPRKDVMLRYSELCAGVIVYAKNGVLSGPVVETAILDLQKVEPKLCGDKRLTKRYLMDASKGLRAVLSWYREYKKGGKIRRILSKDSSDGQRKILEDVSNQLILKQPNTKKEVEKIECEKAECEKAECEAVEVDKAECEKKSVEKEECEKKCEAVEVDKAECEKKCEADKFSPPTKFPKFWKAFSYDWRAKSPTSMSSSSPSQSMSASSSSKSSTCPMSSNCPMPQPMSSNCPMGMPSGLAPMSSSCPVPMTMPSSLGPMPSSCPMPMAMPSSLGPMPSSCPMPMACMSSSMPESSTPLSSRGASKMQLKVRKSATYHSSPLCSNT